MAYLTDSDVIADWLEGRSEAVQLLSSLAPSGLSISLITYGEIYEGIYCSRDPKESERIFIEFLRDVDVLPLNKGIMKGFARIRGHLRATGRVIGDFDVLIADTAIHHQLTLVSRNVRHFDRVPGLSIYQSS